MINKGDTSVELSRKSSTIFATRALVDSITATGLIRVDPNHLPNSLFQFCVATEREFPRREAPKGKKKENRACTRELGVRTNTFSRLLALITGAPFGLLTEMRRTERILPDYPCFSKVQIKEMA